MTSISGVSERDIDLLLLEEFISSKEFQELFLMLTNLKDKNLKFLDAKRSVTDSTGESDLEITFQSYESQKFKLLIENKVNANFQKDQKERYFQRGQNYIKQGIIHNFATILIAPKSYHNEELKGFDFRINYEDIVQYFIDNDNIGSRKKYKILLLKSAIEKSSTGYQMIADESVTNFWKNYWELTLEIAKELNMDEPMQKPSSSSFIYFRKTNLPMNVDLVHKITHGYFDLQFKNMGDKLNVMREKYQDKLTHEMKIVQANKSASIRIKVPKLSLVSSLESQREQAIQCINTGKELLQWFEHHSDNKTSYNESIALAAILVEHRKTLS